MPVLIQINGDTAGEAVKELAALAQSLNGNTAAAPAVATEVPKSRTRNKQETVKETPAAEPEKNDEQEPEESAPEIDNEPDSDEPASDEPIPSVVDLRAKAQEVGEKKGRDKIKGLLTEFECKSISDIPENKRTAFMKALDALLQ